MPDDPTPLPVPTRVLAEWLGLDPRRVQQMAKRGGPISLVEVPGTRKGELRFDLQASVQGYCEYLRELANGRPGGEAAAPGGVKDRIDLLRERKLKVDVEDAERSALPREPDVAGWASILVAVAGELRGIPSRIATRHRLAVQEADTEAALRIVSDAIDSALRGLAATPSYAHLIERRPGLGDSPSDGGDDSAGEPDAE